MTFGLQLRLFGKQEIKPKRKIVQISKEIVLDGVGKVLMVKKSGIRRISISIKPFTGIKVTLPLNSGFSQAEKFVLSKKEWIRKNLEKTSRTENDLTVFDHSVEFTTFEHRLEIHPSSNDKLTARISPGKIEVFYPFGMDVRDPRVQNIIRAGIEKAWRMEAAKFIPAKVKELAALHGFRFQGISIKNAKTRWGSCSTQNNLNFSLHLMRLPEQLRDYIILHELCHTVHKNHSAKFWHLLDNVSGDARGLDKAMKDYRIGIY
ncbi:MAG: SprT family zinc-dependent metalloprotease [Bacteroidia bacterium]|nr:SprT family zinc-dependent metalloprotease [Bacteroidia bacterium]